MLAPRRTLLLTYFTFISSIILFFSGTKELMSQDQTAIFDSIYSHTAYTVADLNLEKAIITTDSLVKHSENSDQKMRSYLLRALLNERKGSLVAALTDAIESEKIAIAERDYEWQVRSSGYLATIYRRVDLISEARKHIQVAQSANQKRKDADNYYAIQSVIHHEMAMHHMDASNFPEVLVELNKSKENLFKQPDSPSKNWSLATIHESFAHSYIALGDYDKGKESINAAFDLLGEEEDELKGLLYLGLGKVEMHYENYDKAYENFKKAEEYAERNNHFTLKSMTYSSMANYYKLTEDYQKASYYDDLFIEISHSRAKSTKQISNELLTELQAKETPILRNNGILLGVLGFALLIIIFLIITFKNREKKERLQFEKALEKIKATGPVSKKENPVQAINTPVESEESSNNNMMTEETEIRLLEELEKMEQTDFYLQKEVSLSALAALLNSNPKYVSNIINSHKHMDFNNYVNKLRIRYIINKFETEPQYLKYKLAFIADECGFSSHSKFAAVFKSHTGISPSIFVKQLKNKQLETA